MVYGFELLSWVFFFYPTKLYFILPHSLLLLTNVLHLYILQEEQYIFTYTVSYNFLLNQKKVESVHLYCLFYYFIFTGVVWIWISIWDYLLPEWRTSFCISCKAVLPRANSLSFVHLGMSSSPLHFLNTPVLDIGFLAQGFVFFFRHSLST
jgi:hypothetical protein